MADILIAIDLDGNAWKAQQIKGPFWRTADDAYLVMFNTSGTPSIRIYRTTSGGFNWSIVTSSGSTDVVAIDAWPVWYTPGYASDPDNDKILLAWNNSSSDATLYTYFDISSGTIAWTPSVVWSGSTYDTTNGADTSDCKVCLDHKGRVHVLGMGDGDEPFYRTSESITSPSWTTRTHPNGTNDDAHQFDICPYNPDGDGRIAVAYYRTTPNDLMWRWWDDTAWSSIQTLEATGAGVDNSYANLSMVQRYSDGAALLAWMEDFDTSTATIRTWEIVGATPTVTEKTAVTTGTERAVPALHIDQTNGTIRCAYINGTKITATVDVVYKESTDGMATWGSEQAYSQNTNDDLRFVHCGKMTGGPYAGRFYGIFINDDLDDLFGQEPNSIAIPASLDHLLTAAAQNTLLRM